MAFCHLPLRWGRFPKRAAVYEGWAAPDGSLTQRLIAASSTFRVEVLREGLDRCAPDEAALLSLRPGTYVYARHVRLVVDGKPVVFARSLVSLKALQRPWGAVQRLGAKPLGAALWSNPRIRRSRLEFALAQVRHPLHRRLAEEAPGLLLARRSLFWWAGRPLLVMEAFLPDILELPCPD